MKICPSCGAQLNDSASFCNICGADVRGTVAQPAAQQQDFAPQNPAVAPEQRFNQVQQNQFSQPVYQPVTANANPARSAIDVMRSFANGSLFLVGIIAFSLSVIFTFISQLSNNIASFDSIRDLLDKIGLDSAADNIIDSAQSASTGALIAAIIPSVLIAVGLWLTYISFKDKSGAPIKTSGLTMIKVINIIGLVFLCIGCAIVEIVLLVGAFGISQAKNEVSSGDAKALLNLGSGLMIVLFIVLAIVFTLCIVYFAKVISSINTAKRTIMTGVASDKVSGFVAVIAFISAFVTFISVFSAEGASGVLAALCSVTASICFGVLIFQYKKAMRPLMYAGGMR